LQAKEALRSYFSGLLQERMGQLDTKTDIIAHILAAKQDPEARQEIKDLDDEAIFENMLAMWFGFIATTSITLTWILKCLADNPDVYRRIQVPYVYRFGYDGP
jgi:cytochrome P450